MSALADFEELRNLENGWNGEGSLAPSEDTFANAIEFIGLWYPDGQVTPNENGTISFQWPGCYLEVGRTKFSMWSPSHFINGEFKKREANNVES